MSDQQAALVAIQELHSLNTDWRRVTRLDQCRTCYESHPCKTRRLADEALEGDNNG